MEEFVLDEFSIGADGVAWWRTINPTPDDMTDGIAECQHQWQEHRRIQWMEVQCPPLAPYYLTYKTPPMERI